MAPQHNKPRQCDVGLQHKIRSGLYSRYRGVHNLQAVYYPLTFIHLCHKWTHSWIGLTIFEDEEGADVKESDVKSQNQPTKKTKHKINRFVLKGCNCTCTSDYTSVLCLGLSRYVILDQGWNHGVALLDKGTNPGSKYRDPSRQICVWIETPISWINWLGLSLVRQSDCSTQQEPANHTIHVVKG